MSPSAGDPSLAAFIDRFLPRGQSRPLRELIDAALHAPGHGYYQSQIRTIGRCGDFATSATLGNALADAIAHWAQSQFRHASIHRHCIEIGAGTGALASGILRASPLFRRPHYHIVDTSPPLRTAQKQLLKTKARWHDSVESALDTCGGHAVLIANELIDAFPPTVLQWHAAQHQWHEVWVSRSDTDQWSETSRPWQPPPIFAQFGSPTALDPAHWPNGSPPPNQRIEIHDAFLAWWQSWLPHWHRGTLLWIDYGDNFPALYHRQPSGTLRAYFHHQRLHGTAILNRFGRQDITADVNFSDIQQWGTQLGLTLATQQSQSAFIRQHSHRLHPNDPAIQPGPATAFQIQTWHRE